MNSQSKNERFPGWAAASYSDSYFANHRNIQNTDASVSRDKRPRHHDHPSYPHRHRRGGEYHETSRIQRSYTNHQNGQRNSKNIASVYNKNTGDELQRAATLSWPLGPHSSPVPVQAETNILPVILRWGSKERGMILSQPPFRLPTIRETCRANNIQLVQGLSLRRTHIKYLNPFKSMEALGLGHDAHIRKSAELFEQAVATFLLQQGVGFCTEEEQRRLFHQHQESLKQTNHCENGRINAEKPTPQLSCTPDFIFNKPLTLRTFKARHEKSKRVHPDHGCTIHWLEAKMFYGASTIPQGTNNAVGAILERAVKYVQQLGPGAIVFAYGCGEELTRQLENIGIQVLDGYPLDLTALREYQKTWCCNEFGEILF